MLGGDAEEDGESAVGEENIRENAQMRGSCSSGGGSRSRSNGRKRKRTDSDEE